MMNVLISLMPFCGPGKFWRFTLYMHRFIQCVASYLAYIEPQNVRNVIDLEIYWSFLYWRLQWVKSVIKSAKWFSSVLWICCLVLVQRTSEAGWSRCWCNESWCRCFLASTLFPLSQMQRVAGGSDLLCQRWGSVLWPTPCGNNEASMHIMWWGTVCCLSGLNWFLWKLSSSCRCSSEITSVK